MSKIDGGRGPVWVKTLICQLRILYIYCRAELKNAVYVEEEESILSQVYSLNIYLSRFSLIKLLI